MGFNTPLKMQNFKRKKKEREKLKIVTHLLWNVNTVFPESMGQTII